MLLLSWIAQGGGCGIVTLDLPNCTEIRTDASPTHPSAQDDVGAIVVKAQPEMPRQRVLGCPFQLFYGNGVEWLGAESAREHVRWVSAI